MRSCHAIYLTLYLSERNIVDGKGVAIRDTTLFLDEK